MSFVVFDEWRVPFPIEFGFGPLQNVAKRLIVSARKGFIAVRSSNKHTRRGLSGGGIASWRRAQKQSDPTSQIFVYIVQFAIMQFSGY